MITDALAPQPGEYDDDNTTDAYADRDPALALVRRDHQRAVEKRLVQIDEIQPVLVEIGETLRFIPDDFHRL